MKRLMSIFALVLAYASASAQQPFPDSAPLYNLAVANKWFAGPWNVYATNPATGLAFLGGATSNYVQQVTNDLNMSQYVTANNGQTTNLTEVASLNMWGNTPFLKGVSTANPQGISAIGFGDINVTDGQFTRVGASLTTWTNYGNSFYIQMVGASTYNICSNDGTILFSKSGQGISPISANWTSVSGANPGSTVFGVEQMEGTITHLGYVTSTNLNARIENARTNGFATNIVGTALNQVTNIASGIAGLPVLTNYVNARLDYHKLYVASYGNDFTATRGDITHPWKTLYDFNGGFLGGMGNATNGDTVVLLTDINAPVIPFIYPNVTLDLNTHTVTRTTSTASIPVWPSFGRSDFLFPFVFVNDNCVIKNGTLFNNTGLSYVVGGTTIDFGMEITFTKLNSIAAGTNIDQILEIADQNGFITATNCGRWSSFGITNNGATNFVADSLYMNQLSYDVTFWDNAQVEVTDTNGNGDFIVQLLKPLQMTFKNCSAFSYWDCWTFKGLNTYISFINQNTVIGLNAFAGNTTPVFCGGEGSIIQVLGGTYNSYAYTNTENLIPGIAGARTPSVIGDGNTCEIEINGLQLLGIGPSFSPIRNIGSGQSTVSGWYVDTNGLATMFPNFTGNASGLTNITANPPTIIKTNLALATVGVNNWGRPIQICSFSVNLSEAGVVGVSGIQLEVPGQITNRVSSITSIAGTIVGSDTNALPGAFVPVGGTWNIRDISQGAGNSSSIGNGGQQIIVY